MSTSVVTVESGPETVVTVVQDDPMVVTVQQTVGTSVPDGGTTGQLLAKASNDDGDVEWVDGSAGGVESDPIFAAWLLTVDPGNWDDAYSWGDHSAAGYLTQAAADLLYAAIGHDHTGVYEPAGAAATAVSGHESAYDHTLIATALQAETDPVFGLWLSGVTPANWDTAYGWGDHAGLYDATGTASGLIGTHESTYNHSLIATALQSESDPVFSLWLSGVTPANWDTAYGWGDHAGLYSAATHASQHESGGGDSIKLDDLAAPDDNTDLDATITAHGLLPKLGGGTTNFLRADGTWAAPAGGAHDAVTLNAAVADVLSLSSQELTADDAGADKLVFWDDSESKLTYATLGTGLSFTGATLNAAVHDAVTLDVNADTVLSLSTQAIGLDTQTANYVFAGPTSGDPAVPAFRALGTTDIPDLSATYATTGHTHSYLANVVEDTTPQLGGDLDANGNTIHFGTAENVQTPAGTTATIDLGAENHHTLDCGSASGSVTLTLTVPPGPCAGTIIVVQGATARDITWSPSSGSVKWLGTEPTWSSDTSKYRIVAWRWNGSILFLSATETD